MDEEIETTAAGLLAEVKALKAWVELERARIAGDPTWQLSAVDVRDDLVTRPEQERVS